MGPALTWQPPPSPELSTTMSWLPSRAAALLTLQILDEVEKRRGISPALVQPLMRSVMEAPFPALGKTIVVKNFLPGSGTEVSLARGGSGPGSPASFSGVSSRPQVTPQKSHPEWDACSWDSA